MTARIAASAEVPADCVGGVGAIRKDRRRAGSWPAGSSSRGPDSGPDRLEGRRVAGLACGDVDGQRPGPAVTGRVDLLAQATTRASECVVLRLRSIGHPVFFPDSCRMLVSPADSGVDRDCPVRVVIGISHCKDRREDPFPCAVHGPPDRAFVDGLKRLELLQQVAPG
jgi:hypothetical protein